MRKSKRLTALLLAVITICGLIPFSMVSVGAASRYTPATRQEIVKAVGAENIMLMSTLDDNSLADHLTSVDAGAVTFGNQNGTRLYPEDGSADYIQSVSDGNGGYAWQYGPVDSAKNNQAFCDIQYRNNTGGDNSVKYLREAGWTKKSFVVSMDVKGGDNYKNGNALIQLMCRAKNTGDGPNGFDLIMVNASGGVYCSLDSNKTVLATLSKDKFTNIAVYMDRTDPVNSICYIYVDGVLANPEGYAWGTNANGNRPVPANAEWTWLTKSSTTVEAGEYFLNGARIYHIGSPADAYLVGKTSITIDNPCIYFTDVGFVGERTIVGPSNGVLYGTDGKPITTDGTYVVDGKTYVVRNGLIAQDVEVDLAAMATGGGWFNKVSYEGLTDSKYVIKGGLSNWEILFTPMDISGYDSIKIDVYRPANYTDFEFHFIAGQRERTYLVELTAAGAEAVAANADAAKDPANYQLVLDSNGNPAFRYGGVTKVADSATVTNGSKSVSGRWGTYKDGNETKYGLRVWYYNSSPELDFTTKFEEGWNTYTFPISSIGKRADFEIFQFTATGWSLNTDRTWNTSGSANTMYTSAALCDIQFKNLRLVKSDSSEDPSGVSGWSDPTNPGTGYYVKPGTDEKVKGFQVIDGKWYQFTNGGACLGMLDGMYSMELAGGASGGEVVNRYFIDGVLQFGTFEDGGNTYVADANTGALDMLSSQIACKVHIPSATTFTYSDTELFFNNHHYQVCRFCGVKLNPVEHTFENYEPNGDGTKTATCVCGKEDTIRDMKTLKISGYNLTLYDSVKVGFRVNADELFVEGQYKNPYIKFKLDDRPEEIITEYETVNEGGVNYYVFKTSNVFMQRLGDTFTVQLCAVDDNTDEPVASEVKSSSVKKYCYAMLEQTSDANLKTLIVDLLNYGAAAQVYGDGEGNGYKTDALVNAELSSIQQGYGTTAKPNATHTWTIGAENDSNGTEVQGIRITTEGKIELKIYFYRANAEETTVEVALKNDPEKKKVFTIADFVPVPGENNKYYIYFSDLTAAQMREVVVINTYDKNGVNNSYQIDNEYSIEAYATYARSEFDDDTNLMNLVDAMLRYGDSAANYLENSIN